MTRSELLKIVGIFVLWRVALSLVAVLAPDWLAYQPTFPYAYTLLPLFNVPQWLYSWANFDGVHYITIVSQGYLGIGLVQAFFPLYPILIELTMHLVPSILLSGLLISNLFALLLFVVWFTLAKDLGGRTFAWRSLACLILFPTSYYFGALYTESLFLTLAVASFLAARRQRWWLAGGLAALASGTRVVGVLLVPSLLLLLLQQQLGQKSWRQLDNWWWAIKQVVQKQFLALVAISLGVAGLLAYTIYLQIEFQDPLYFFHVQAEFGGIRQESLVLFPQVLWRSIKILMTVSPTSWRYLVYIQEFVVGLAGLAVIIWSFTKAKWWPYSLFSLCVLLIPTFTGTFSSLPRYALTSMVLFLWLPWVTRSRPWVLAIYLLCSSLLLLINTVLFIQGYWVA